MQIPIPKTIEAIVLQQAQEAGYDNAAEYVVSLILSHEPDELSPSDNERLERLASEGLASGDAGPMTDQDWANIRAEVQRRTTDRESRHP